MTLKRIKWIRRN